MYDREPTQYSEEHQYLRDQRKKETLQRRLRRNGWRGRSSREFCVTDAEVRDYFKKKG